MRAGLLAAALGIAGVGAFVGRPAVVLLAAVPLAGLAAGSLTAPRAPSVSVSRTLSTDSPELGERVTVRVAVTNEGRSIADCHIADDLPSAIGALDATETSVRLPSGATATLEYTAVARRGTHAFGDVTVTARGLTADASVSEAIKTTFRCRPESRPLSLRPTVRRRAGDRSSDTAGSGVEFHSVREYRLSDPQRRIDWRRFARSGELTTVEFREDAPETLHLLVDARPLCAVRGGAAEPTAVAYCADAAERLTAALTNRGIEVGVGLYPESPVAVPPGSGRPHRERVRRLLDGHGAFPWSDGAVSAPTEAPAADGGLPDRLRRTGRVVLLSPCLDDRPVEFVEAVHGSGGDIGLLSPAIGGDSPGAVIERAERAERLDRLSGGGIRVVDWDVEAPLERAVAEVFETWT
jgi:uncharacterized protein (DUF58 family)